MTDANVFSFLNQTRSLDNHGWDDPKLEKLWRYNLHYFHDLTASAADEREAWHTALIHRWIRENPPGSGTAWEPYPTSLRIVNWIKWALAGHSLPSQAVDSLAVQTRWLARRVEFHLRGNHLVSNAKALVFAGSIFEGAEADSWIRKGLRLLKRQVAEQFLPDGGHFERSTMYHSLALEDLLDISNIMNAFRSSWPDRLPSLGSTWQENIDRAQHWLAALCHPDGKIGFFNDATFGVAASLSELDNYAEDLGFPQALRQFDDVCWLKESGYIRVERDNIVALLDVAPIAVDYLPGHGHADTLSFELSLKGQRVFVNSGVSTYEGADRIRQRGTESHNTLRLDGRNSSEVWGSFRVGRRARVTEVSVSREQSRLIIEASHDGYKHLPGSPVHSRKWLSANGALTVEDTVRGSGRHSIEIYYYLHPDFVARPRGNSEVCVQDESGEQLCLVSLQTVGELHVEDSSWHPEFGLSIPSSRIVFRASAELPARVVVRIEY